MGNVVFRKLELDEESTMPTTSHVRRVGPLTVPSALTSMAIISRGTGRSDMGAYIRPMELSRDVQVSCTY